MKLYGTQFINVEAMAEGLVPYVVIDVGNRFNNDFISMKLDPNDARRLAEVLLQETAKCNPPQYVIKDPVPTQGPSQ